MTKIAVIIGSNRQGRVTDKLATWVAKDLQDKAEVSVVDLQDFPMSFISEEISPRYNPERKAAPEVQKWLDAVAAADGYVIVSPEYNRAMPGVLKNALDQLGHEMDNKPVGLVAHGARGGAEAVASLRVAVPGVGGVTLPEAVYFPGRVAEVISDDGELAAALRDNPYGPQASLATMTASLVGYAEALATMPTA